MISTMLIAWTESQNQIIKTENAEHHRNCQNVEQCINILNHFPGVSTPNKLKKIKKIKILHCCTHTHTHTNTHTEAARSQNHFNKLSEVKPHLQMQDTRLLKTLWVFAYSQYYVKQRSYVCVWWSFANRERCPNVQVASSDPLTRCVQAA